MGSLKRINDYFKNINISLRYFKRRKENNVEV